MSLYVSRPQLSHSGQVPSVSESSMTLRRFSASVEPCLLRPPCPMPPMGKLLAASVILAVLMRDRSNFSIRAGIPEPAPSVSGSARAAPGRRCRRHHHRVPGEEEPTCGPGERRADQGRELGQTVPRVPVVSRVDQPSGTATTLGRLLLGPALRSAQPHRVHGLDTDHLLAV